MKKTVFEHNEDFQYLSKIEKIASSSIKNVSSKKCYDSPKNATLHMSDIFASFEQTIDDLVIPEPSMSVLSPSAKQGGRTPILHKKTKSIVLPAEKVKLKPLKSKKELKIKKQNTSLNLDSSQKI